MVITRALSEQICRVLSGVLLFAQISVASYACPGLSGMKAMAESGSIASMAGDAVMAPDSTEKSAAMRPGCDQIDQDTANLCTEHCRFGQQSVDSAPASVGFAPIPALLYWLPLEPEPAPGSARSLPASDAGLAAPAPPHAILHCVYRI